MVVCDAQITCTLAYFLLGNQVLIQSEALCIKFVLHSQKAAAVVDVVTGSTKIRATLDRTLCHIEVVALSSKLYNLASIKHVVLVISTLFSVNDASEDHYLLTSHLDSTRMKCSQFLVVSDVVDRLPQAFLYVIGLDLLHELKRAVAGNIGTGSGV